MHLHDIGLVFIAFLSEVFGVLSGFGSSSLFVPLASFFEKFYFVLALTSILHCFGNVSKILLFRKNFDKRLFLKLFLPSILLTGIGALLVPYVPIDKLKKILGIFLIVLSTFWFFQGSRPRPASPRATYFLTALSGFFTGLVGTGGALRGMALNLMSLEKNSFVALSAGIDFGGDFIRMIIYLSEGMMDWNQWFYIPLLGIAALAGAHFGKKLLSHMSQRIFEKGVAFLVGLSGTLMILSHS